MTMANRAVFGDSIGNIFRATGATKTDAAGRRVTHFRRVSTTAAARQRQESGAEWAGRLAGRAAKTDPDPSWKTDPSALPGSLVDGPSWKKVPLASDENTGALNAAGESGAEWAARVTGKKK